MTLEGASRRMPAEWEPQAGVMLTWPHEGTDWAPRLVEAEACFTSLAGAIGRYQDLLVVCRDEAHRAAVRARLLAADIPPGRLRFAVAPSDDTWARDHGPITVIRDGRPLLLDYRFDGWGGKFPHAADDAVTGRLHADGAFGDVPLERIERVLEGGAIDTDGRGTLLTTRHCLLESRGRVDPAELEAALGQELGVDRLLWLDHGHLVGDDTDGHVDTLARFAAPDTILFQGCRDHGDEHYGPLAAMAEDLEAMRTTDGQPYRLLELPLPRPVHDPEDGRRLPAGYANFLVVDGAVLVPAYGVPEDSAALAIIAAAFPGRRTEPVDCLPLVRQNGSLHCVTMQLPHGIWETGRDGRE